MFSAVYDFNHVFLRTFSLSQNDSIQGLGSHCRIARILNTIENTRQFGVIQEKQCLRNVGKKQTITAPFAQ